MESYKVPKKYNYEYINLDTNSGINFLSKQKEEIKKFRIDILKTYKMKLELINNVAADIISGDINSFLLERKKAEENIFKSFNKLSKGMHGEDKVRDIIYQYDGEFKILRNATFSVESNKIENDFIIVDESGINTIEVKDIGSSSEKLIIDKYDRVSRVNKNNFEIENYDMIQQSNRHLAYLSKFIDNKFTFDVPVNSIIVIASNIKIINEGSSNIIGPNQIYNAIKLKNKRINQEQIKLVYKELSDNLIDNIKYSYIDYITVLNRNYNLILKSIKELFIKY
ncbi:MAG: nuclease-related domain-containing protein [Clostridium celatum]|uniref:nuclease-related domain-containing protein n=1 Tax=Clostridium tertium TaxID=1559 RepID=UPI002903802C|nr:nuclease-related domain-containing protein [Clostridium celatum]